MNTLGRVFARLRVEWGLAVATSPLFRSRLFTALAALILTVLDAAALLKLAAWTLLLALFIASSIARRHGALPPPKVEVKKRSSLPEGIKRLRIAIGLCGMIALPLCAVSVLPGRDLSASVVLPLIPIGYLLGWGGVRLCWWVIEGFQTDRANRNVGEQPNVSVDAHDTAK